MARFAAAAFAALAALRSPVGAGADTATDVGENVLVMETFDWQGGAEAAMRSNVMPMEPEEKGWPTARGVAAEEADGPRRLGAGAGAGAGAGRVVGTGDILDALWSRPTWRDARFDLKASDGEHPCFAGYSHMMEKTDRCGGWARKYPDVGGVKRYSSGVSGKKRPHTLRAVVADMINVWTEEGTTTDVHADIAAKAARIYTNDFGIEELRPAPDSSSWMEHECKVMGSMPFMYTCSNRVNILVQQCNMENAFVKQSDYLRNFPEAANHKSPPNHDIVFYMCRELLDRNPNPYAAANTFAHELAHVIQGGFGYSFGTMTEGGATWLEGPLLHLAPRPMVYAWGFRDWNRINAAHIYAQTRGANARKFYQIHAMLLTYLSQPELLGDGGASALQNYQTFESDHVPYGRGSFDYFLSYLGKGRPSELQTLQIDTKDTDNAFATALLDFRVALASQCIEDPEKRPAEARYLMPAHLRERPFWDCTSYPTWWSADGTGVDQASADIHYGGAAVFRLAMPQGAEVSVSVDADPRVRTKVLAAGASSADGTRLPAEVRELAPGEKAQFGSAARELFVVQVNVDPSGETVSADEKPRTWSRTAYRCAGRCSGQAWHAGRNNGRSYRVNQMSALRSPLLKLEAGKEASISFDAMWDLEAVHADGSKTRGCPILGYDAVQLRLHVYGGNETSDGHAERSSMGLHEEGSTIHILQPDGGYTTGPNGEAALEALSMSGLYKPGSSCDSFSGWTGRSSGELFSFSGQRFSLTPYAGRRVRFEILFASDGAIGGEGFWLDNIVVRSGGEVVFTDFANPVQGETEGAKMFEHLPMMVSVEPGAQGKHDGVPVVAGLAYGHEWDRGLEKGHITRSAPWSATWTAAAEAQDQDALRRRAYLGWSYAADVSNTKTMVLHPWQEACMTLEAPFTGAPKSATLFGLVDKIGVSAVSLVAREASVPYAALSGAEPVVSLSPGVEDPGTHRFNLTGAVPVLEAGMPFLLCLGVASVKTLPADGDNEPFLHLPLTNVSTAGEAGKPGATFIRVVQAHGNLEIGETSGLDPWHGHTFVLRAEFVEAAAAGDANGGRRLRGAPLLRE